MRWICRLAGFRRRPDAGESEIRAALGGNLYRCTGYTLILRGAALAQQLLRSPARDDSIKVARTKFMKSKLD